MAEHSDKQLQLAELFALDLEADTREQLQMLQHLRSELELRVVVGQGAMSVARERFRAATLATDALLRHGAAQRELLADLRATLYELRRTLAAAGHVTPRLVPPPSSDDTPSR